MPGSHPSIMFFSAAALLGVLAPAKASASTAPSNPHGTTVVKAQTCAKAAVEVVAGSETATFPLAKCDGTAMASSVDQLSILGRPGSAPRPSEPIATLAKIRGTEIAPGVHRLDPRLVERLQLVVDHFARDGQSTKIVLVSGYRPKNSGTYHSAGRALDFRIDGVKDDALVAFCKTLPDTGCGYYPNNVFVHMDVRQPGTGHVSWIDSSLPESPAHSAGNDPPKDPAAGRRDADENAKSDGPDKGAKPADAPGETNAPGLLLARPVAKTDDKPSVAAKDEKLPPLPGDPPPHRVKHKHKTRKAHDEQRSHDDARFL